MRYQVRLSNINPDFSVEPPPEESWSVSVDRDEEMVFLMNRVAVTASQETMVEFPELEITVYHRRVTVTVIGGLLYYTDPRFPNRRNMKLVAEEVVDLLRDEPLEADSADSSDPAAAKVATTVPLNQKTKKQGVPRKGAWLLVCGIIVVLGAWVLWKGRGDTPTFAGVTHFIPIFVGEQEMLDRFSDVYVSEYTEGGGVFQLSETGQVDFYEFWYSDERRRLILVPTESHHVQVGAHEGEAALLAGETHLLLPKDLETISLHSILYRRHRGPLSEVGEVLNVNRW